MPPGNGRSRRSGRPISRRCCRGRAPTISSATAPARTASSPADSSAAGGRAACCGDQYGNPDSPFHDIDTGERNTGPESLSPEALKANREDYIANVLAHPTLDAWYRERISDLEKIELPTLAVANWGGLALHLRGTIAG